jgi:hypothetical protein
MIIFANIGLVKLHAVDAGSVGKSNCPMRIGEWLACLSVAALALLGISFLGMIVLLLPCAFDHSGPPSDDGSFLILACIDLAGWLLPPVIWIVCAAYWYATRIRVWFIAIIWGLPDRLKALCLLTITIALFTVIGAELPAIIRNTCTDLNKRGQPKLEHDHWEDEDQD